MQENSPTTSSDALIQITITSYACLDQLFIDETWAPILTRESNVEKFCKMDLKTFFLKDVLLLACSILIH